MQLLLMRTSNIRPHMNYSSIKRLFTKKTIKYDIYTNMHFRFYNSIGAQIAKIQESVACS